MKQSTLIAGKKGEEAAVSFLRKKGYKILKRNFRLRNGEIDIIALDGKDRQNPTLVFIEVKTRSGDQYGTPFEAIGYFKMKYLTRTAVVFSTIYPEFPKNLRIDAVGILLGATGEVVSIEHIENVSM